MLGYRQLSSGGMIWGDRYWYSVRKAFKIKLFKNEMTGPVRL